MFSHKNLFKWSLTVVLMLIGSAKPVLAISCVDLINTLDNKSLFEFYDEVESYTDLHAGIDLFIDSLPKDVNHPTVSIELEDIVLYDGERTPGRAYINGQNAINALSPYIYWGPYSEERFVKPFKTGESLDELFISVHSQQSSASEYFTNPLFATWHARRSGFVDRIITELLEKDDFSDVPRLFLTSKDFPITSQNFLDHASVVQYSYGGELTQRLPLAEQYHIVGECFRACVKTTVVQILNLVLYENQNISSVVLLYKNHLLDYENFESDDLATHLVSMGRSISLDGEEGVLRRLLSYRVRGTHEVGVIKISYDDSGLEIFHTINNSRVRLELVD